jgi:hypothetical protein
LYACSFVYLLRLPHAFSRHFGLAGWFSLSLGAWVPKESGAANNGFGGAMLLDRRRFRFIDFRAALTFLTLYARADGHAGSAGCYGVARQRAGSRQNSIGGD